MGRIELSEANLQLNDLVARVEAGESIEITRGGKIVARLLGADQPRKPIDRDAIRAFTDTLPVSSQSAGEFVRWMRDTDRY